MGKDQIIIDAGIAHIHIKIFGRESRDFLFPSNGKIEDLFRRYGVWQLLNDNSSDLFITGKLAEIIRASLKRGEIVSPLAALWARAKNLARDKHNKRGGSVGIIDLSASGYTVIAVDRQGEIIDDLLIINPKCGAGSGLNLGRILEKLAIKPEEVDTVLRDYLGEAGEAKRRAVSIRADRCGVFSASATISDKNQGIPLDLALAVTMKSEALKAARRLAVRADTVYLTGRVLAWQYMRDCAADYLREAGVRNVRYDEDQSLYILGVKNLAEVIGAGNFRRQPPGKLRRQLPPNAYPSFRELKERYERDNRYRRLSDPAVKPLPADELERLPVQLGIDVGSTMAKMVIADAASRDVLFINSYDNHGDTIETIKHIFRDLKRRGVNRLKVQHIGLTGSGRYQVQKVLKEVYPPLKGRITALVENYAHVHGSLVYAREHINYLRQKGEPVNEDFYALVDIGGEDTKVSLVSLRKADLYDNAMNIKCSAGTGSLMDTLKALFNIADIKEACRRAYASPRAFEINATCAVFLMENAKKMQAQGYDRDEILASCNYAIVENMARTLWNQIEFPRHSVVMLHGQTMLSEPLPLAATRRLQAMGKMYGLVPPLPGHQACLGLIKSIKPEPVIESDFVLDNFLDLRFEKKLVYCRGAACGDKNACCARTLMVSAAKTNRLSFLLGGCTAVNEMAGKRAEIKPARNAYQEIWQFVRDRQSRSDDPRRLVIPRSFVVSEQAYFLSRIFARLGIPVRVDNVIEADILAAQPLFEIDVCAPLIGAVGQFMRLAKEPHGVILAPQIDYLPTGGKSAGKTCTTNQGGIAIARNFAQAAYPGANIALFDLSLDKMEAGYIAHQLMGKIAGVFGFYGLRTDYDRLSAVVAEAIKDNDELKQGLAALTADCVKFAVDQKFDLALVCGREYILNPGIYDSHIGRLLTDKGITAIPAYALETVLAEKFRYIYWRNPHDLVTKISAVAGRTLHKILKNRELAELIKKIETGQTDTAVSIVEVSTFRCGPDTVIAPTTNELTKNIPGLYIQSDAMIKELAHLENRVNTLLNQLQKKLHREFAVHNFDIKIVDAFSFGQINRETDAIYLPTLHDNRLVTSVIKAAGITVVDNFRDREFDLEKKVRLGRQYVGDTICAPLAAVYADIILAARDFLERQAADDPLVRGKQRVLIFDNKGQGPCRQGQYFEQHKLCLYKKFSADNTLEGMSKKIKLMVAHEQEAYNIGLEEWALAQAFHGLIIKSVLDMIMLKAGASCRDLAEYNKFYQEFLILKSEINGIFANKTRPADKRKKILNAVSRQSAPLGAIAKYFGYGLYNNNGIRKLVRGFSRRWLPAQEAGGDKIRIHIEGEVYMRGAQFEDIFNSIADAVGFNRFSLTYTPLWSYFEWLLEMTILNSRRAVSLSRRDITAADSGETRRAARGNIRRQKRLIFTIKIAKFFLRKFFIGPLFRAARIEAPHEMGQVLKAARRVIPTLKPYGELTPYLGEALVRLEQGTDLFLNVAPEGCMVSAMGEVLTPCLLKTATNKKGRIQHLFSLNGELDEDQLHLALLKSLGPEKYYRQ